MKGYTYICIGSVRGECGHRHRTLHGAVRCLLRDRRECRGVGGGCYSDREIRMDDGGDLDRDTFYAAQYLLDGHLDGN